MQLPWDEHFREIVIPAWQAYLAAERSLSEAVETKDHERIRRATYDALREGGAAAFYLHHFAEIVMRARPEWLPSTIRHHGKAREWLAQYCTALRTEKPSGDVKLLGHVANALKHAVLSEQSDLEVAANDQVLVVASNWGEARWGEGKWGPAPQVTVRAKSGTRVLSSILQNVVDAWRRAAKLDLPGIGVP